MKLPFDAFATPQRRGDAQIENLYLSIGYLAQRWEHLMVNLFIETSTFGGRDFNDASVMFSGIPNAYGQINTAEKVMLHGLTSWLDIKKEDRQAAQNNCKAIFERIRRLSKKRNKIIHGTITDWKQNDPKIGSGLFIQNPDMSAARAFNLGTKPYFYTSDDILQICRSIDECRQQFNAFCDECRRLWSLEKASLGRGKDL